MTIQEAITRVDALKPNQYEDADKIYWLDHIERILVNEVFKTHEDDPTIETETDEEGNETKVNAFHGYDITSNYDTELLTPDPYSDLYVQYIMSQIDYTNGEFQRYANTAAMFNTEYANFTAMWNREHKRIYTPSFKF